MAFEKVVPFRNVKNLKRHSIFFCRKIPTFQTPKFDLFCVKIDYTGHGDHNERNLITLR